MQACAAALRAERARIAGRVSPAENVRAASRRTAGATFARTRWLACMQRADALASMHAARSARGCVCGGMRTNTSFEIQAPGVRSPKWVHHRSLPPDVPALPPSTVLSSLCPVRSPASPRPRPPPSLPESSPPLGLEFHLFLVTSCPQSCNFRPLLRKDGRMHCFEKRSVIMSHLKYEIERIRHDPHDKLLKSSPFCSEPAAAVSITCQETPNRTASPFDELPPARMRYLAHSKLSEPQQMFMQCSLQLRTKNVRGH